MILIITLSMLSCAPAVYHSGLNLNSYAQIEELPLDSIRLYKNDLPEGYSFSKDVVTPDIQTAVFYNNPTIYSDIIGGEPIIQKATQNFIGPDGEKGTIFYIFYTTKLNENTSNFLEGFLWGGDSPNSHHPEELFVSQKTIIIWGLPTVSKIKQISQTRLYNYIIRHSN